MLSAQWISARQGMNRRDAPDGTARRQHSAPVGFPDFRPPEENSGVRKIALYLNST